jgi:hypothetical protein
MNRLVLIIKKEHVFCEVGTEVSNVIQKKLMLEINKIRQKLFFIVN